MCNRGGRESERSEYIEISVAPDLGNPSKSELADSCIGIQGDERQRGPAKNQRLFTTDAERETCDEKFVGREDNTYEREGTLSTRFLITNYQTIIED